MVTINHFKAGNIFGEALVFSGRHVYPATIISSNQSEIMYIKREEIVKMMTFNPQVIENFMGVLSNRILMLNNRITNLSYDTLRKKSPILYCWNTIDKTLHISHCLIVERRWLSFEYT